MKTEILPNVRPGVFSCKIALADALTLGTCVASTAADIFDVVARGCALTPGQRMGSVLIPLDFRGSSVPVIPK